MYAERALRAGAKGYIMKRKASSKNLETINSISRGKLTISFDTLSDREWEVYRLIGHGFDTCQIARKKFLGPKTIDFYQEHLKIKLRLAKGPDLVQHAIQWVKSENVV